MDNEAVETNRQYQLNDTILSIINDYTDVMIMQVRGLYEIFIYNNKKDLFLTYLQAIPVTDCDIFWEMVYKDFNDDSVNARVLMQLNITMKFEDCEKLKNNKALYRDILNGRICNKPANNQEALNMVHAVQKILIQNYNKIASELIAEEY